MRMDCKYCGRNIFFEFGMPKNTSDRTTHVCEGYEAAIVSYKNVPLSEVPSEILRGYERAMNAAPKPVRRARNRVVSP